MILMVGAYAKPQDTAARQDAIWDEIDMQMIAFSDFWFHEGDFPKVIQVLRFRYELHPDDWEAVSDLGWMLESTDRPEEALSMYVRYRKEYPARRDAAYSETEFYFRNKAYAKVPPLVEPELSKRPHANMYRWLAHAYDKLGRFRDSIRVWDLLIGVDPSDQAAKNNRERVRKKLQGPFP